MVETRGEVTRLLADVKFGGKDALDRLIPLFYGELRRIASRQLRDERTSHTLQPAALVHEAFLRLVGQDRADWQNPGSILRRGRPVDAAAAGGLRAADLVAQIVVGIANPVEKCRTLSRSYVQRGGEDLFDLAPATGDMISIIILRISFATQENSQLSRAC